MSTRRVVYIGLALVLLVVARFLGTRSESSVAPPPLEGASSTPSSSASSSPSSAASLRHPASAVAELGVLTDRPDAELGAVFDREAIASLLTERFCGPADACDAVRTTLRDERATTLHLATASDWDLARLDVDGGDWGGRLSPALRAAVHKATHVAVVHVSTAITPHQLAVRTALAVTAAVADKLDAAVYDQLLARIESAHDFAAHAITAPLGESAFDTTRIEVLFQPKGPGIVRLLTAGLSRWGAPDVEIAAAPDAASERLNEILVGVAAAVATQAGPSQPARVTLARDDVARASGHADPPDAGLPPSTPVPIDLTSVHPEAGDPNDFMARVTPPSGTEALGYLELAERFFGPVLAAAPDTTTLRTRRDRAQQALGQALDRWQASRDTGATLLVQLPFPIPGGGAESMWIDVTASDARNVTGSIVDEPLAATDFTRGQSVTRPRADVEDVAWRTPPGKAARAASAEPSGDR